MSSLLEGARRLLGRRSDLAGQIGGLQQAVDQARGRLAEEDLAPAAAIVERAGARLRLSPDHTVVALAGATGSGKSSTFNALAGVDLASTGVRRPTTSWATACLWGGPAGAEELLEWMGIPQRHQTTRDSMLDKGREAKDLRGLVLLDLPDHDSTEVAHHLEVERLIVLADLMVWILDPQKYADAAVHQKFLAPLAGHKDVMIVVLNHIDEVPRDKRQGMIEDVRRLLALDGLEGIPVVATSATTGDGIPELKRLITQRVQDKKASRARFRIDVHEAAERLDTACGSAPPRELTSATRAELTAAVADAAGVPVVVDAVQRSSRLGAARATGWPPLTWVSRLRPDPLKRLHLDLDTEGREMVVSARSSVPEATQVQRARVDTAVRHVADEVSGGLAQPWVRAVRRASTSHGDDFADAVDRAITSTPLGAGKVPLWCRLVQVVQWLAILAVVAGLGWLAAVAVMDFMQLNPADPPHYGGLPAPTLLLVAGLAIGLVLAAVSRVLVRIGARNRARSADRRLRQAISGVTEEMILRPVDSELEAYKKVREGLQRALA
ncbi:ABC transporter [Nocardioides mangrovicus]|uniref:ABC transporter n=1 Tax=Nocardioides mangrovicus TaxID=2478913 RepID=A0A3L8P3S1_9ACTN|nr:ABC transporter [Nocardioides mangrovicus]RLV49751.1 ABC transporter [Nocardioides mangrovicus]